MSTLYGRLAALSMLCCVCLLTPLQAISAPAEPNVLEMTQNAFRQVYARVAPAVVSISTRGIVEPALPLRGIPESRRGTGSGVIIRPEGIVLTNSHVVENATKVTVRLANTEKDLPAEVVQTDARSDLAIVRILEPGTYPVATLGDANAVQVGDWAIALGSPYRLPSTMTVGVVSATGRNLRGPSTDVTYRDLLQTDASINPGNSGGPLVTIRGEVVGINFMIFSPGSAGSVGIGFAIPINDYTKQVINTLIAGKTIERGRLGVAVKNLDDAMREATGVKAGGVFIDSVAPGTAAEKAGLQAEDVLVSYNGTPISNVDQFISLVERTLPGTTVTLRVVRNGEEIPVTATVGAVPADGRAAGAIDERKVGLAVSTLTPEINNALDLPINTKGVVVTGVMPGTPAEDAGLERGDIVLRVGKTEVQSEDDFWGAVSKEMATSKYGALLRVRRGATPTTVTLPRPDQAK